ncbi:uncharacterized protein LOC118743245 isoform X2 [Rhagoletis pomonella]|nr:uncharacterized protein LOC118743245 isoform X2 [Rhagoletis pomonella]
MERKPIEKPPVVYSTISSDIWYHVADHIPPEYVQTFALICRQTADFVNTRRFWNTIYKKYCLKFDTDSSWILELPEHLQAHSIRDSDKATMRASVVEALFRTYPPLSDRIKQGYSLDKLLGSTYESSWHEQENCVWVMCYKFRQKNVAEAKQVKDFAEIFPSIAETDDWETLAENSAWCRKHYVVKEKHVNDGISLLVIRCERFIPFPNQLLYENGGSRVMLSATRQMLAKDMCGTNLELDFGGRSSKVVTTVKYPKVVSCKVYPWWHPDFRKYVK